MRAVDASDVRASAVIVVGGTTDGTRETQAMLLSIRDRLRAAAVALAHVPTQERAQWFVALVAEIAHNGTFDTAVMRASRREWRARFAKPAFDADLTPPLVEADPSFVAQAVMEDIARRIARAASALPQAAVPAGLDRSFSNTRITPADTIKVIADSLATTGQAWHHETGDSTRLAEFRRRVEELSGQPLGVPPLQVGARIRTTRAVPRAPPSPPPPVRRTVDAASPPVERPSSSIFRADGDGRMDKRRKQRRRRDDVRARRVRRPAKGRRRRVEGTTARAPAATLRRRARSHARVHALVARRRR